MSTPIQITAKRGALKASQNHVQFLGPHSHENEVRNKALSICKLVPNLLPFVKQAEDHSYSYETFTY